MFVCLSECVGHGLGSWFMWMCFGGLRAGFVGVSGWHQRQTAGESGLYQQTHPRRRTPIWAGGAQGEAWLSGCAEGRKLKGTCCFDSAFDWWRLATDRYALKSFQWCSYTSEKSDPHTHTHTRARTNRQTVWSGVSELSPGWRISLREANTPLFLRRLIISAEKQRRNTTWSECMHSKWTKSEISPCSTSTNPFAQSSVVPWNGVKTITILKRLE